MKLIKSVKGKLKNNLIYDKIYHEFITKKKFKTEIELLKDQHSNPSVLPSIIHFSLNKSATTFVKELLCKIGIDNGMVPVRIHDYAFNNSIPYFDSLSYEEMRHYKHVFKPKGYVYSVFGGMVENIDELDKFKLILMIRDPRDILVSEYYSIAYSHPEPSRNGNKVDSFATKRNFAKEVDINTYVLNQSNKLKIKFDRYLNHLVKNDFNIHLTKYRDMIDDFEGWLNNLLDYLEIEISMKLKQTILDDFNNSKPTTENKKNHNRKGKSGDFLAKLSPATIDKLNMQFAEVIKEFDMDPTK